MHLSILPIVEAYLAVLAIAAFGLVLALLSKFRHLASPRRLWLTGKHDARRA